MNDALNIEERIGEEAVDKRKRGQRPSLAMISVLEFRTMHMRLQARVDFDDLGEYVTLHTAAGRVVVRPSPTVDPDRIIWPC